MAAIGLGLVDLKYNGKISCNCLCVEEDAIDVKPVFKPILKGKGKVTSKEKLPSLDEDLLIMSEEELPIPVKKKQSPVYKFDEEIDDLPELVESKPVKKKSSVYKFDDDEDLLIMSEEESIPVKKKPLPAYNIEEESDDMPELEPSKQSSHSEIKKFLFGTDENKISGLEIIKKKFDIADDEGEIIKMSDNLLAIKKKEIPEHIFKDDNTFKRKFKNYIPLISSDTFDEKKLTIMLPNYSKGNFIIPVPVYRYDEKNLDSLLIQTSFMDVNKAKISYKIKNTYKNKMTQEQNQIKFDPSFFDNKIIDILLNFDNKMVQFVKNTFTNKFKCSSKMIYNKNSVRLTPAFEMVNMIGDLGMIKGKLCKKKFYDQYNKLLNYNISKKYDAVEQYELSSMKNNELVNIFDRILTNNKEIRMLLEPFMWINLSDNTYGSYLNIIMIEVKYKHAKIYSILDKNETSMKENIINVEI